MKKKPGPKKDSRRHAYGDDRKRNAMLAAGGVAGGGALTAAYVTAAHDGQRRKYAEGVMKKAGQEGSALAKAWEEGGYLDQKLKPGEGLKNPHSAQKSRNKAEGELSKKLDMRLKRIPDQKKTRWESNSSVKRFLGKYMGRARVPWKLNLG